MPGAIHTGILRAIAPLLSGWESDAGAALASGKGARDGTDKGTTGATSWGEQKEPAQFLMVESPAAKGVAPGAVVALPSGAAEMTVGRSRSCGLALRDLEVSSLHAALGPSEWWYPDSTSMGDRKPDAEFVTLFHEHGLNQRVARPALRCTAAGKNQIEAGRRYDRAPAVASPPPSSALLVNRGSDG